jgi:hypothetical protein
MMKQHTTHSFQSTPPPKQGPDPTLLSRKQVDALYETFQAIVSALKTLNIPYIITGGSLLGAIRQHSILFCDDDIDITIIETTTPSSSNDPSFSLSNYQKLSQNLQRLLGDEYMYSKRPWEGGDKVRPKRMSNIFIDIFTLRQYDTMDGLKEVIGMKKNGLPQPTSYIENIVQTIEQCCCVHDDDDDDDDNNNDNDDKKCTNVKRELTNFWHFNERKAIEMWPKEVYQQHELFPLNTMLHLGPYTNISGPRMPILLLQRAFGDDCFHVYYQSGSHQQKTAKKKNKKKKAHEVQDTNDNDNESNHEEQTNQELKPIVLDGGNWSHSTKVPLLDEHYIPLQPIAKAKRRHTIHDKNALFTYIEHQSKLERQWLS